MTDRTWHLYLDSSSGRRVRARGLGSQLLRHVEDDITRAGGRLFLIETSSLPSYEPTRKFYIKHGYEQAAVVRDFYAAGDGPGDLPQAARLRARVGRRVASTSPHLLPTRKAPCPPAGTS